MDNIQQLIIICQKMHSEGKTPSVGMLRSKAPFKASVTDAIEAIKRFNASKKSELGSQHVPTKNKETHESALERRVIILEQEVAALKQSLSALLNKPK
ncbi:hypothetical protein [Alteromonas sp. 009811495]|uniref:hypothetical protein n=1 Tax=Alteromonas sp. 009811495 TaxID=3002962 RepID=UPI00237D7B82|nr:hypothetical protein [Alteromonas sp. 009811495]WDT87075.1 hypothetical protein OZ660_04775 [Alteromonas sp. 009811495]